MTRTDLIKNLEYTKSKYKDKFFGTCETNIYEMVSDILRYLNQPTTEIDLDYYHELKEKADKWDEKETPVKPKEDEYGFNVCVKCDSLVESECGKIFNYCPNCGQRIG